VQWFYPPSLLQLIPFWLFSLQHSKTPAHSKHCCRDCFEHRRLCHSQQLLQHLHRLPVYFFVKYKIAALTYKVVTLNQLLYLTHLLALYTPGRSLWSQDKHLLLELAVFTVTSSWGFSYAAPSVWNKLPFEIHSSSSFSSFRGNLKTLFLPCFFLDPPRHLSPWRLPMPQICPFSWPCARYKWLYCIVLSCCFASSSLGLWSAEFSGL